MASATTKTAGDIFEPMVEEGGVELERSFSDLVLSGLIAGLDIGFGPSRWRLWPAVSMPFSM